MDNQTNSEVSSNSAYPRVFQVQNRCELLNNLIHEVKRILRFYGEKDEPIFLKWEDKSIQIMVVTSPEFNLSENSLSLYSIFNMIERLLNSNANRRNLNIEFWFHQIDSENLNKDSLYSDGYNYTYRVGKFTQIKGKFRMTKQELDFEFEKFINLQTLIYKRSVEHYCLVSGSTMNLTCFAWNFVDSTKVQVHCTSYENADSFTIEFPTVYSFLTDEDWNHKLDEIRMDKEKYAKTTHDKDYSDIPF